MEDSKNKVFKKLNELFSKTEYQVVREEFFAKLYHDIEYILKDYPYYKIFKFTISEYVMSDDALKNNLEILNMESIYHYIGYLGNNKHLQIVIAREKPISHIFIKGDIQCSE